MDDFNPVPVAVIDIGVPNVDEQPTSPTEWVDIDPPNEALEEEVVLMGSGSETDPEVCLVKSEGTRRKAILWPALEKREGKRTIYPFLDRENCDRDYQLCSLLAVEQIFLSSHGRKNKVWEEVRATLCGLRTKNNELLFPDGISNVNTLRRRVSSLMAWIKKYRDSANIRSGTDDEDHSEFISLLENLLEQKETAEEDATEKAAELTKVNQRKSAEAEVLRLAAISTSRGRKRLQEMVEETGGAKRANKSPSPSSTSTTSIGAALGFQASIEDERKIQKEQWEKALEFKRMEATKKMDLKMELKKLEAAEKSKRYERELEFREKKLEFQRQMHLEKVNRNGTNESASKGLDKAIYALLDRLERQDDRLKKMESTMEKLAKSNKE